MHIQAHSMNLNSANPYSAASESAASANRGAEVRRKLLRNSTAADGSASESDLEHSSFLAQGMSAAPGRNESDDEYHSRAPTAESDFA